MTMRPAQPQPPRRPRPGPRPGPRPVAPPPEEPVKAPGSAAYLRRNRKLARHGAGAAIAGGVALFVVASVSPLAGADSAKQRTPAAATTDSSTVGPLGPQLSIDPAAPAVSKILKPEPTHVKNQAPVTHGVISGLAANGIPQVALNAYRVAAARMADVEPGCGIDWALLAGIGREESDHGRFAGAVLHADGVSTPSIIGPALDGVHWDYVPAPANGLALDGDAKYAHALGPMQFIPSTWATYGTDATGDGRSDIFNINDAALGAARYLCAAGGDLRSHAGEVRAVLAYNHSDEYLAQVLALADAYRRGVPVTGLPVGITTGALPKVTDTGYIPPVNPGPPTAVEKSKRSTTKPKSPSSSSASPTTKRSATSGAATTKAGSKSTSAGSTPGRTGTSPAPTGSTTKPTPTATPTPEPTKTCNPLEELLGCVAS
jgi:membrane-bound lytic murein transglycosylase B